MLQAHYSAAANTMHILLVKMGQSPYNRSIWMGFLRAFRHLGHMVQETDAECLPDVASLATPPDLLFAVHGGNVPVAAIDRYRAQGVRTAVYLLDEPYEVESSRQWAQHYEWVFSVDQATVPVHATYSHAAHLPLAYDASVFTPHGPAIASEILLLGSPFKAREELLAPIRERWGNRITWVGPGWRSFSPNGQHVEGFVSPEDCARFYRGAKVVINIHRDSYWSHFGELNPQRIIATHLNPRFWEAAGCGAFQLVSERADLHRFAPKAVRFGTAQELEKKLEYYLAHERSRVENARRTHKDVRNQTYLQRAQSVLAAVSRT